KRQRRPVEQLQTGDIFADGFHRGRKSKSGFNTLMQLLGRNLVTNESRENFAAAADKIHLQHRVDVGQFKLRQFQRKEQTLLRTQTLFHRLGEADLLVVILKIVEFHALSQLS